MKRALLLISLFFAFAFTTKANYVLNDAAIDQLFTNAYEVQLTSMLNNANTINLAGVNAFYTASEKNAIVAALLAFFLGGWAIHRYYLGTKSTMFFYYFCTCGGIFGVVPLIDFIMLLVDSNDISKYCNNEKFIMWM